MTQQPQPPRTPPAAASRPGQPSIGELINRISENITGLVKGEIELARAKALRMANAAGIGAALLTVAAVAALFGLGFLLSAIVDLLAMVMPVWAAKLIVVVILFAVAVATALPGRDKLREAKADKPEPPVWTRAAGSEPAAVEAEAAELREVPGGHRVRSGRAARPADR